MRPIRSLYIMQWLWFMSHVTFLYTHIPICFQIPCNLLRGRKQLVVTRFNKEYSFLPLPMNYDFQKILFLFWLFYFHKNVLLKIQYHFFVSLDIFIWKYNGRFEWNSVFKTIFPCFGNFYGDLKFLHINCTVVFSFLMIRLYLNFILFHK